MQTVFFCKTLKTNKKLHQNFRRYNRNFTDTGFFLGTDGNRKHRNC